MSDMPNTTFLGIDLGTFSIKMAHTNKQASPPGAREPEFFRGKNNDRVILSSVLVGSDGKYLELGQDILRHRSYLMEGVRILNNLVGMASIGDSLPLEWTCHELTNLVRREFNVSQGQPLPIDVTTVVSLPPNVEPGSPDAHILCSVLEKAGFPRIQTLSAPLAVIQAMRFGGRLSPSDSSQHILVIDLGARSSSMTHVCLDPSSVNPELVNTSGLQWSGSQVDTLIFEKTILKQFWQSSTVPSSSEADRLRFVAQLLKQSAFAKIKKGNQKEEIFTHEKNVNDPVSLRLENFINSSDYQQLISDLRLLLGQTLEQVFAGIDFQKVIICGGGANFPGVPEMLAQIWEPEKIILPSDPELQAARGAALALTGFQPQEQPQQQEEAVSLVKVENIPTSVTSPSVEEKEQSTRPPVSKAEVLRKLNAVHNASRKSLMIYVVIGTVVALLVSFLPCVSWPFLMIVEIVMFYRLTRNYNYSVSDSIFLFLCLGLFGMSIILTIAVGVIVELFPIINIALKPILAALIIWGMGEGAIWALDKQSAKDNYRNIIQVVL
jgi:hypothetical protein